MTNLTSRRSTRVIAIGGLLAALLIWPAGVAADTGPGGGNADLGLDGITISATSVQGRTGLVTVTGQIHCSQDLQASVGVDLTQVVGRFWTIQGSGYASVDCLEAEGTADFSLAFYPWSGKFAPGQARLQGYADTYVCTGQEEECSYDSVGIGPLNVRLSR